jgi:hypothetical protein
MNNIILRDESVAGADLRYRGERIIFKELWPEENESCSFQWKSYFIYSSLGAFYRESCCALLFILSFSISIPVCSCCDLHESKIISL